MSAKQFQHFMQFHQQLAGLRRVKRAAISTSSNRASTTAVATAKEWLAGVSRQRPYSPSL
jgi:hypothetical protein